MDLGNGLGHLTYSTLVHPADDWEKLYVSSFRAFTVQKVEPAAGSKVLAAIFSRSDCDDRPLTRWTH